MDLGHYSAAQSCLEAAILINTDSLSFDELNNLGERVSPKLVQCLRRSCTFPTISELSP